MKGNPVWIRALASCRRVLLLLALGITVMGALAYLQSPSLDQLRPKIESYLKNELQLQQLKLGELSWYWAGYLWIESDQLDFVSSGKHISFHDGGVAVRISMLSLLQGNMTPGHIRLDRGALKLQFPEQTTTANNSIPVHGLRLNQVDVDWQFGSWQGKLPKLQLQVDRESREIRASSAALTLKAHLDADGLPDLFQLHSPHIDWLPASLRRQMTGDPTANISLKRRASRIWDLNLSLQSRQPFTLMPTTTYSLPLNALNIQTVLQTLPEQPLTPQHIQIGKATWTLGSNTIAVQGEWAEQTLALQASSERLPLPLIWSWLRPLGDKPWHQWLARMQHGTATSVEGVLSLPWADPFHAAPTPAEVSKLTFNIHTSVADADIALGSGEEWLTHLHADVAIDQQGLSARIDDASLPHQLGQSSGKLHILWSALELNIQGHAQIDAKKLLNWKGPSASRNWQWTDSASDATYSILWNVLEATPRQARAKIQPINMWDVRIQNIPLQLGGMVEWDQADGIHIEQMQVAGKRMQGTLSLAMAPDKNEAWHLINLDAQGQSDLAIIAAHFRLPVSHAGGMLSTSLAYDGHWFGKLDLTQSRWDHLLGSAKTIGEPFAITYEGRFDDTNEQPAIMLTRLKSHGHALQASGSAHFSSHGLKLDFSRLKTPGFDGALTIDAPFGQDAWTIKARADYLNRNALPQVLDHLESAQDKPWVLDAKVKRFDWADARMSGVNIKLSSATGSTGQLEASLIHTARLDILDVNALFAMLGKGEIDLRHLDASVEKQRLNLSARLTPEPGGGLHWRGFATIQGDFGHLMQRGKISERFKAGNGHVLFSGHGIMLREQPWWKGMQGRLRLRVDNGRVLEGGTLTTFLSAINLADLPKLLLGKRNDLSGPGIMYERLQMEAFIENQGIRIRNIVMRSSAFDLAGHGNMDIDKDTIDLYLIVRPLQNLDAILSKIPLLRDLLGGQAHSLMRKVYHMHGLFTDAKVDVVSPKEAGLASGGLIERLFSLPENWFGKSEPEAGKITP